MADLVGDHMVHLQRRNLRPSTIYQRRRVLARLAAEHPGRDLLELTGEEIASGLDRRGLQPTSRATEIAHLVAFYAWVEDELDVPSPMRRVAKPKLPRRMPRPMPDDDVVAALAGAPERVYPILMLATYAGLRAAEIAQLRGEDVLLDRDPPIIVVAVSKGGSPSTVTVHPELVPVLAAGPRLGPVIPRRDDRTGPCQPWLISHLANAYLHSIGIGHTLHTLRHWFGTKVHEASGGDLRVTQEAMRHQSIASTVGYAWVAPTRTAAAVAAVPPMRRRFKVA